MLLYSFFAETVLGMSVCGSLQVLSKMSALPYWNAVLSFDVHFDLGVLCFLTSYGLLN